MKKIKEYEELKHELEKIKKVISQQKDKIHKKNFPNTNFYYDFFFSTKKKENLFVCFPRSGTFLTIGMLNICYSMQRGHKSFSVADDQYKTLKI